MIGRMKSELMTIGMPGAFGRGPGTGFCGFREPAPPLKFPNEEGILSCIYDQVRQEERVMSVQFLWKSTECIIQQIEEEEAR